jgi:hypothetical protein
MNKFTLACSVLLLCTVALGQLPTGTQGEPLINTSGSNVYATDGVWVDATQFSSAGDMCQAIQAAAAASTSPGCKSPITIPPLSGINPQGCFVKAAFQGQQTCSVDPFAGWGNGGILDLRGATLLDIRTSKTWHLHPGVKLIGGGTSDALTTGSQYFNTILRANNTGIFGTGSAFSVPSVGISGITVSGNTATITTTGNHNFCTAGAPNYGQDAFIYGASGWTGPANGAYHGLANGNGTGGITCASPWTIQVQVPSSWSGCLGSCGTLYAGTPVIQMNVPSGSGSVQQFRSQVEGYFY